ncbi:Arginine transport ATP-binding protein ArtM [Alloiococcus otitis]|uniref:ABC transporter domain-containing protein n=1 Tax=Alloiococcus otitis ATCC 51267 TaxID=883081 RepID=K9EWQ3_9LACT|nr:ABC transporter ATP-binding protein [Alloiococcus otitis]EKU93670.1 hypothetical protein HMPREF9698_00787 [Alloiococcus otitis ATCC 51267]SUU80266.1 Arginine transport ATP-binding protein ArtM [Alloiococcus otitis]
MALKVEGLSKQYPKSDHFALQDVSFSIEDGEIVGLVGRNGSGKTTLLKILTKALRPSQGKIYYQGQDLWSHANQLKDLGVLIRPVFYDHLTVLENLKFYLTIHQAEAYQDNIEPVLKLVDLWDNRQDKPSTFSFGMEQRLSLAISLLTEPNFLVLDEPFVGLDPDGVRLLIQILKKASQVRQTTMIISSHQLAELEAICQRFLFIEQGRLDEKAAKIQGTYIVFLNHSIKLTDLFDSQLLDYLTYTEEGKILRINQTIDLGDLNKVLFVLAKNNLIQSFSRGSSLNQYFERGEDHD